MKVVPNRSAIRPGYLYAYLASRFGIAMITSGTYGAIIQHIEAEHIADMPVPRLGDRIERKTHDLVEKAANHRSKAAELRRESQTRLTGMLSLPDMSASGTPLSFATFPVKSARLSRLDAAFHSPPGVQAVKALAQSDPVEPLGTVATAFQTNIFKRP